MNIYLVVEGRTEDKVYPAWVKFINSEFKFVNTFDDVKYNTVYIVSGGGYPSYLKVIENAAKDMICLKDETTGYSLFDRLVVAVDAEEMAVTDKIFEVMRHIYTVTCSLDIFDYKVIIHNFCLETWFLANDELYMYTTMKKKSEDYRSHYDVAELDPEKLTLPQNNRHWRTRAQYASDYLKASIIDKWPNQTYSKRNPGVVLDENYLNAVRERFLKTEHIQSIRMFFDAFV